MLSETAAFRDLARRLDKGIHHLSSFYSQDAQIDLLQQSSFHESKASSPQLAQKKFLGKVDVGSDLLRLATHYRVILKQRLQGKLLQVVRKDSCLGVDSGGGHAGESIRVCGGVEMPSARKQP